VEEGEEMKKLLITLVLFVTLTLLCQTSFAQEKDAAVEARKIREWAEAMETAIENTCEQYKGKYHFFIDLTAKRITYKTVPPDPELYKANYAMSADNICEDFIADAHRVASDAYPEPSAVELKLFLLREKLDRLGDYVMGEMLEGAGR
jgi:hypothetical protein